jgi:drug/metabolite transporter (DMT)-like permease
LTYPESRRADLAMVLVTLLAAAGWIFSKETLAGVEPLSFLVARFGLAGAILGLFALSRLRVLTAAQWQRAARTGFCFGLAMQFWILGLQYGQHLGVGAFITSLGVVMVPLVAWGFGDSLNWPTRVALLLAASGLAALGLDSHFDLGWGELAFFMAACLFALTFVLTSRAASDIDPLPLAAIQMALIGLVALPVALIFEPLQWQGGWQTAAWLTASILLATCIRFFLQVWSQSKTSASNAAIILILEPVWTAILGWLWYEHSLTLIQLLGCGLIVMALLASRWQAVRTLVRR